MLALWLQWPDHHITCWLYYCIDLTIIWHADSMAAMTWPSYYMLTIWLQWPEHHITWWLYFVMTWPSHHMLTLWLQYHDHHIICWLYGCNDLTIISHVDSMVAMTWPPCHMLTFIFEVNTHHITGCRYLWNAVLGLYMYESFSIS